MKSPVTEAIDIYSPPPEFTEQVMREDIEAYLRHRKGTAVREVVRPYGEGHLRQLLERAWEAGPIKGGTDRSDFVLLQAIFSVEMSLHASAVPSSRQEEYAFSDHRRVQWLQVERMAIAFIHARFNGSLATRIRLRLRSFFVRSAKAPPTTLAYERWNRETWRNWPEHYLVSVPLLRASLV